MLTFNIQNFYILSNVLNYVWDFPVGQGHINIYLNMVKQVGTIFKLRLVFASSLAKVIKKNKSWEFAFWTTIKVDQVWILFLHYMRLNYSGRHCQEGTL